MNDRDRLEQLDVLIDRLERLPASPNRDWMIGEVRARRVDVETGVRPGPIRARTCDAASPPREAGARGPTARRDTTARRATGLDSGLIDRPETHRTASKPAPAPSEVGPSRPATDDGRVDLLEQSGVLCLGELPAEIPADAGPIGPRPWARGLRG